MEEKVLRALWRVMSYVFCLTSEKVTQYHTAEQKDALHCNWLVRGFIMTRSLESTRNFCLREAGERVEKNLMKISMKITFRAPTTRSFIPSLSDEAFFLH